MYFNLRSTHKIPYSNKNAIIIFFVRSIKLLFVILFNITNNNYIRSIQFKKQ